MIKAILFDLDDTLIGNPFGGGGTADATTWDDFFAAQTGRADAGPGVARTIAGISRNIDPTASNMHVYLRALETAWGMDEAAIMAVFETFYTQAYPQMQAAVAPRPAALPLLNWLWDEDLLVVIATHPVFRAEAVAERLGWGGLPTELDRYALVTHIENMHFAKPCPHYYEEILGRLGLSNDEALMVGNDWVMDIQPAIQAGLNTFWIKQDNTPPPPGDMRPDGQGTLNDFALLVRKQNWLETLRPRPLHPSMIGPRLLGNVGALFGLLNEHAPDYWRQHPDPDEWSPLEVVCHLRDSERAVQRPRLQLIASEDDPFLSAPKNPPGPGELGCDVKDYCDPAEQFAVERHKTVQWLATLPPEAWARTARHSIFGPTTLLEMANFTATHDRLHLQQICQTIGRCE